VSSLVTRLCCPVLASGTVSSVLAPPCQMIRRSAVRSPLPPAGLTVMTISAMTAEQLLALHVGGGRRMEYCPQVGAGGGDPGGFLPGQGDRAAGLRGRELVAGDPGGVEPGLQGGLQGPGNQPVLRLQVVVLAPRPVGFEAGARGCIPGSSPLPWPSP
jgi:hypothetical protein